MLKLKNDNSYADPKANLANIKNAYKRLLFLKSNNKNFRPLIRYNLKTGEFDIHDRITNPRNIYMGTDFNQWPRLDDKQKASTVLLNYEEHKTMTIYRQQKPLIYKQAKKELLQLAYEAIESAYEKDLSE